MGPLSGMKVIELAGIGPAPFCAMMLADAGAEVIRIERASAPAAAPAPVDPLLRNRRSIALDLKNPEARTVVLRLVESAEALIEGFRPGVTERLGIGPEVCLGRNPRLIYGRMTGWGQQGPLAQAAGHDINYISLAGALNMIGPAGGKPVPPLNLIADFGGGGMLLAFGVLAGVLEARRSGKGQVIDAAMVDGVAAMMGIFFAMNTQGVVRDATGQDMLAGGAPWYDTYLTKDGRTVSIAAIEPQFFRLLLQKLELDVERFAHLGYPAIGDDARQEWPALREAITAAFASRTRDEWCRILEGTDACFAPILSLAEAPRHPHNMARRTFIEVGGIPQNAPAPRFSATVPAPVQPPHPSGADTEAVLREVGYSTADIARLRATGTLS
ncbi:MAG TPA: CaiB/BaiF CoA-transferase family protein [Steroidobacteraceae bacterium]|nr:CaiB/BaiF CoA-transferase family protein [Steroidobacteraceae bacterium]